MPWLAWDEPDDDVAGAFPDPKDFNDYLAGDDFNYGLAGIRDAEFEDHCDSLRSMINVLPVDTSVEVGFAVHLPLLPFGSPSFSPARKPAR